MLHPKLPSGLPVPVDDGACEHLAGLHVPMMGLPSSSDQIVNLAVLKGTTVVYIYPKSGPEGTSLPDNWDAIPGARGCSPQSCSFRDHKRELAQLGARVFGLSTQDRAYLADEVARLDLPFELLSDSDLRFKEALNLPVMEVMIDGEAVLKRATLIILDGIIEHVFYPVFPPDESAQQVLTWLVANPQPRNDDPGLVK